MTHTAIVESGYQTLPLSVIDESTTNPRRTFEPAKLVELAQSISIHGMIQPITVRPKGDRFELVAGARRFRAAKIAEQSEVPVRILTLTDEQTLEVQIIENSQREDVHPYEEAAAYQSLLDLPGYDVAALASKCGKSQSHIYARLSLLQLTPEVAQAFQEGRITASHANLIARLTQEQQEQAFQKSFRKDYQDDESHLLPAKHLAAWINTNLYLALTDAPFSTEDPALNAEAGACVTCPRRTGFNTQLFADLEGDSCLDATCYHGKVAALIAREMAAHPGLVQISTEWRPATDRPAGQLAPNEYKTIKAQTKEEKAKDEPVCPHVTPAIITHGHDLGRRLNICADQDCSVHRPQRTYTPDPEFAQRQQEAQQRREAQEKEQAKRQKTLRSLIFRFPSTATDEQMRFLLKALVTGDLYDAQRRIARRLHDDETAYKDSDDVCAEAIDALMPSSLVGFLAELALGSFVDLPQPEERDILKEALALFPAAPKVKPTTNKATTKRTKIIVKTRAKVASPSTAKRSA